MITLKVIAPLYGGLGLAKDGIVYFVRGSIPGETVEAEVVEKKRDYTVAAAVNVVDPSEYRQSPVCPVYGLCGGCHYQHITYEKQLVMKQEIVCDCLRRIGRIDAIPFDDPISGDPLHYRHRAQFKASRGKIGFYKADSREVVEFEECYLLRDELNLCYKAIKGLGVPRGISEISVTLGDSLIAHFSGTGIDEKYADRLLQEKILQGVTTDEGSVFGRPYTMLDLMGFRYSVSARSFFQSNWPMNLALVNLIFRAVVSEGDLHSGPSTGEAKLRLIDIFGGGGNFSLPLVDLCSSITVVEENPASVSDGVRNAELNAMRHLTFVQSSFEEFKSRSRYDTAIIDPPRVGLSGKSLARILQILPRTLLYISCNPATLSRDASKLKEYYELKSVRLVDMFPQTYHCEIFAQFRLK